MALRRSAPLPHLRLVLLGLLVALAVAACSGPENDDPTSASNPPTFTPLSVSATPTAPVTATPTVMLTPSPIATATATSIPADPPALTSTAEPTIVPTLPPTPTTAPEPTPATAPEPTATPTVVAGADDVLTIRMADTDEKIVALTFDAGADRGFAAEILDTLRDEGVVATFGMTGAWAEDNPDLVLRMVDEGHALINHTDTHRSFTGFSTGMAPLSSEERAEELRSTETVIEVIVGYDLQPYFRPPYGDFDDSVLVDLAANGYTVNVMWTVDSLGWRGLSAEEITRRVVDGTAPGAIHLFHVGAQSQDAAALPAIIDELRTAGYQFVTVDDMAGH